MINLLRCFKFISCFYLCFAFVFSVNRANPTFAFSDDTLAISLACDNPYPVSGEEITFSLNFLPSEPINVSAYRLKVKFDSSKLSYKGLYSYINNDDFKSYTKDGDLTVLFVTSENGVNLKSGSVQTMLELNFKVLSSCDIGPLEVSAVVDGLCDYDATAIPLPNIDPVEINVVQTGDANCDLATLSLDDYTITPAFSADITTYSVDVPYSKSTIEFITAPLDDTANVKANRKTLKSAGTVTDVNLTVTSADKKSKKVYTVKVNRLSKEDSTQANFKSSPTDGDFELPVNSAGIDDSLDDSEIPDESVAQNNAFALQQASAPLVVKESAFNIILFAAMSIVFIGISVFIIKRKTQ